MSTGKQKVQETYEKWWLGKKCRTSGMREFKKVTQVIFVGPASGMVGIVKLYFEDGTNTITDIGSDAKRPRKMDVDVEEPALSPA